MSRSRTTPKVPKARRPEPPLEPFDELEDFGMPNVSDVIEQQKQDREEL